MVDLHDHGCVTSFGRKLVETSRPMSACQTVIPNQVFGSHSMPAGRMCRKNFGRPQGTCPWRKVGVDEGGSPGKASHWQECAPSLLGQQ